MPNCSKQDNERTGTPMARLGSPNSMVASGLNVRTEGMGVGAAARSFGKAHSTILRWEATPVWIKVLGGMLEIRDRFSNCQR
ncbi:hypothetical protein [Neosynechococcus sphagnicola]|uniref:hypothetical protein n=1 Tax=Neosynechococcus sphagnicola TaxID=1501145 RepID=UPI00068A32FC|nr:hypothetical protein [Neosynechococcus sphagnicola]